MKEDRTSTAKNRTAARIFFYVAGICILALGLTLSTKTKLGASPIIAVAFCISELSGIELGDATFFLYSFFILVQIALHLLPGKRTPSDKVSFVAHGRTVVRRPSRRLALHNVPLALAKWR